MPLSAWVLGRVAPDAGAALPPAPAADALIQAERGSGQPAAVPGVAWLEVPVGRVDRSRGKLLLAAGADFGLAPGMPVVFGAQWLGRVGETGPRTAEVELASGAARRTPVLFAGDRGELMRAVLEGRGGDARPLVRFLEAKGDPVEGAPALFRRGAEDPPAYAALETDVGALLRVGDPQRGTAAWEVDFELPAGAEGRVFVGAGAVSASVVAEPPVVSGPAALAARCAPILRCPRPWPWSRTACWARWWRAAATRSGAACGRRPTGLRRRGWASTRTPRPAKTRRCASPAAAPASRAGYSSAIAPILGRTREARCRWWAACRWRSPTHEPSALARVVARGAARHAGRACAARVVGRALAA
jgi:hypothetical protein